MRLISTLLIFLIAGAMTLSRSASAEATFTVSPAYKAQQKIAFDMAAKAAKSQDVATSTTHSNSGSGSGAGSGSYDTLIDFKEWTQLSFENQQLYLVGVQQLMKDLENEDLFLKTEYQSASTDPQILNWFLPTANAADETRRCIYAGWVSEMDINNRFCMTPKSQGCGRGQVQCNPLLYGEKRCETSGRSATSLCRRNNKKPISQIVKEIRAKGSAGMSAWANFRSELKGYCDDPRPSQHAVCSVVRSRMVEIERVIGKGPNVASEVSPKVAPVKPSSAKPKVSKLDVPQKISVGPSDVNPSSDAEAPGVSVAVVASAESSAKTHQPERAIQSAPPEAPVKFTGSCGDISLIANMKLVRDGVATARGLNLMSIESAQAMMCTTDPIPANWVAVIRERMKYRIRILSGNDPDAKYAKLTMQTMLNNFEACYDKAKKQRASGVVPAFSPRLKITPIESRNGDTLRLTRTDGTIVTDFGVWSDLEGSLKSSLKQGQSSQPISICDVVVPVGAQAGEAIGPIAVPPGSTGAIR